MESEISLIRVLLIAWDIEFGHVCMFVDHLWLISVKSPICCLILLFAT